MATNTRIAPCLRAVALALALASGLPAALAAPAIAANGIQVNGALVPQSRIDAFAAQLDDLGRSLWLYQHQALLFDEAENLFYADRRFKLLVILQGMDAAGKDGTLRAVFGRMSPLGVRTVGWKAPTDTEKAHDYLWRIHQQMPGAGEIEARRPGGPRHAGAARQAGQQAAADHDWEGAENGAGHGHSSFIEAASRLTSGCIR